MRFYANVLPIMLPYLQIAVEQGCTAIHPGYGFLSENVEFCTAINEAGITWLGPNPKTMEDFALKHVARGLAHDAGVRHEAVLLSVTAMASP